MIDYLLTKIQKYSGGYIRDRKEAENVLLIISALLTIICIAILVNTTGTKKPDNSHVKKSVQKYEMQYGKR